MKFNVKVVETLSRIVVIEALSGAEAVSIVEEMRHDGEVNLQLHECESTELFLVGQAK
jgi:hypothetical protein